MEEQKHEAQQYDPPAGCLLRLFWMVIGNAILLFCAYGIIQHRSSLLGIADVFYWGIVGSLLATRYVDIRYFHGTTSDGDPASLADWRRYTVVVVLITTGLWLVAHAIAHFGA